MTIFDSCKELLNIQQVALYYGVEIQRGKASCPFHKEKTASLSFKNNMFKCFGCGVGGDVIKFVSLLFKATPLEAVKRLNADFNLRLDIDSPADTKAIEAHKKQLQRLKQFKQWEKNYRNQLVSDSKVLTGFISKIQPFSVVWCKAIRQLEIKDYHWQILHTGSTEDKARLYKQTREVKNNCTNQQQKKQIYLKIS